MYFLQLWQRRSIMACGDDGCWTSSHWLPTKISKCLKGHFKTKMRCIIIARLSECRCKTTYCLQNFQLDYRGKVEISKSARDGCAALCLAWHPRSVRWKIPSPATAARQRQHGAGTQWAGGQVIPCPGFAFVALFFVSVARKITLAVQ